MPPLPGPGELMLIIGLVAIVFVGEKLSSLGDGLGRLLHGGRAPEGAGGDGAAGDGAKAPAGSSEGAAG